jgi:predicted ATP-grasp superfamily ATP-dependent carboligase
MDDVLASPVGAWMMKPLDSANNLTVPVSGPFHGAIQPRSQTFLQQFVTGQPYSAVFLAREEECDLLGITYQLVGVPWLHAPAFVYCGSVGPVRLSEAVSAKLMKIGTTLALAGGMRGLFGLDFVVSDDTPWPVEINPRYTASVEILELASGLQALSFHRKVFDLLAPETAMPPGSSMHVYGKGILFAEKKFIFPSAGPWQSALKKTSNWFTNPDFADIPAPGEQIEGADPVLTFFVRGTAVDHCLEQLHARAGALDRLLHAG